MVMMYVSQLGIVCYLKAKHKILRAWDYKYVHIVYNSIKQFYELM